MASPVRMYTQEALYALVDAPLSNQVPGHLKEFTDLYVADQKEVKGFQASVQSFAEASNIRNYKRPEPKGPNNGKGHDTRDRDRDREREREREQHRERDHGGKGDRERDRDHHRRGHNANGGHHHHQQHHQHHHQNELADPDQQRKFEEWAKDKLGESRKWNSSEGIPKKEMKQAPKAAEGLGVDAQFAKPDPTLPSTASTTFPEQKITSATTATTRAAGSKFLKHFPTGWQQHDSQQQQQPMVPGVSNVADVQAAAIRNAQQPQARPMEAGGTEAEVMRRLQEPQQRQASKPLDAASFEKQLFASHSQAQQPSAASVMSMAPAQGASSAPAAPGLVDVASLERSLMKQQQPQVAPAPSGTYDAAALERQLLADAVKGPATGSAEGQGLPPLVAMQAQAHAQAKVQQQRAGYQQAQMNQMMMQMGAGLNFMGQQ